MIGHDVHRQDVDDCVRRGVHAGDEIHPRVSRGDARGVRDSNPRRDGSKRYLRESHAHVPGEVHVVERASRARVYLSEPFESYPHVGVGDGGGGGSRRRDSRRRAVGVRLGRPRVFHEIDPRLIHRLGEILDVRGSNHSHAIGRVQRQAQVRSRLIHVHRAGIHGPKRLGRLDLLHDRAPLRQLHDVPFLLHGPYAHASRGVARRLHTRADPTKSLVGVARDGRIATQSPGANQTRARLRKRSAEIRPRVLPLESRIQRNLVRRARRVRGEDARVVRINRRAFRRFPEESFRLAKKPLVQRRVERDVHTQRSTTSTSRATRLLRETGDGPWKSEVKRRVEVTHVHAQFQRVGRRHAAKFAAEERALRRAAIRRRVPSAVRPNRVAKVARARAVQVFARVTEHQLAQFLRLAEGDAAEIVTHALRQEMRHLDNRTHPRRANRGDVRLDRGLLPRRSRQSRGDGGFTPRRVGVAVGVAVRAPSSSRLRRAPRGFEIFPRRRVPHQKRLRAARRTVLLHHRPPPARVLFVRAEFGESADEVRGVRGGIGDCRRRDDERGIDAVRFATHASQATHHERDVRPEHAAIHVRFVQDDVPEPAERGGPFAVVGKHGRVKHIRIGENRARFGANPTTFLLRGIPVVHPDVRDAHGVGVRRVVVRGARGAVEHRRERSELIARQRFRGEDVHRRRVRVV